MIFFGRLFLALSACLFLTNCGLINTALRLAPYLLMFAEENPDGTKGPGAQQRGQQIQERGRFAPPPRWAPPAQSQMAAR